MAPNILRLRLTVRRHGVPDVKLVWPCDLISDPTIAQLLTQINEVIPLESVEWGLEDYALELSDGIGGSFECLHFQTVASTLKAEDQIMIRPLMTDDIKQRKLGGRDQISRDGKHLLDGMAFGRRWLRAPRDRPMLDIPARKRARLTYPIEDAEDELLEGEEEEEVVDDAEDEEDCISNDDDNDSGSSTSEDVGSEDFESEGSDEEDTSAEGMDEELQLLRRDNADAGEAKDTSRSGLLPTLDCVAALQIAFPLVSKQNLRTSFRRQGNDIRDTYEYLKKRNNANYTFDEMMDKAVMGVLDSIPSESESETSNPRLLMPPRPLIQEVDEPNAPSTSVGLDRIDELVDAHISSDSDSETSSSASSSSDSSDSDSDSESDESFKASSDSDSDDSSDSDSDNDSKVSEEPITKRLVAAVGQNPSMKSAPQVEKLVPPGSGLARTQKRNARRKLAKKMKRLEALDVETPVAATATDPMDGIVEELAARKRALLESMSTSEHQSPVNGVAEESVNAEPPSVESSRPRTRIDVGAGKRILFGALGIKPPKSQDDEIKIRQELMKDVRPVQNARLIQEVIEDTTSADDADDSWRENIVYRAVECCHEGIELSEPPFPFVQRWDSQQQYQPSKKRKRKVEYEDYQEEPADDSYIAVGDDTAGELNYDDEPPAREPAPQIDDDLPPLPHDVTTLPGLEQHAVVPGMVITWKQLVMSKATNWQPELKGFTALVVSSTNDELQLTLAKRDRNGKSRQYDNETGQRIYDKFEAPDMDDDDDEGEEEDDGHRSLPWADLTDPRLLHCKPTEVSRH
ncbi:hypothetical protein VHEMI00767 [[Torrubiella] hemipterigena]|uniref:DUF7357 domain-containing protein n=1 Tax=[Torrubiella] hemipterigena TaxID=1531966 RepID=A0A0A1T2V7_9HYPO|nr:hypothetical protein VHEMI00767 [[Torrubiella] hemipterigena]